MPPSKNQFNVLLQAAMKSELLSIVEPTEFFIFDLPTAFEWLNKCQRNSHKVFKN